MWYIYDTETSKILSAESKHWLRAEYKTKGAAQASLTRRQKKWEARAWELKKKGDTSDRSEITKGPLYTAGLAEADYYHKNIERFVTRKNMMSGEEYRESINTPNYMSPSSEAYWSM